MRIWQVLLTTALAFGLDGWCFADWPQWGGPNRDFRVKTSDLATDWPDGRPEELWRRRLGDGYAGITVVDDDLFTMYRKGETTEVVVAIDAATGETRWEYTQEAPEWPQHIRGYGLGPLVTPLVVDDRVFVVGIRGTLLCLNRKKGQLLWRQDLWEDFNGTRLERGYASSPIAYGETLIVPSGGRGKSVIAFDQSTGKVVWESGNFENAYSSPILIEHGGSSQVVVFMANEVAGFDADDGRFLWSHPHRTRYDINASTPIWGSDNTLFISSAYDTGSRAIGLEFKDEIIATRELWYQKRMQIQHGTAIRLGDTIYGSSGDFGPKFLVSVDVHSGELLSRQRGFAKANLIASGNQVIILDEDGQLGIATAHGDSLAIHDTATILYDRSWTVPTLVGTTLYARNQREIAAFNLGKEK
tara:strand:- start:4953 stop:6197 length:1245 start_codon:yes stop_codon:yes gene_type:complete